MVRAKFMLKEVHDRAYSYQGGDGLVVAPQPKRLVFEHQYDQNIPEDQRFEKATPTGGRVEMFIDNPAALAQFELGKQYYVDFSPAE